MRRGRPYGLTLILATIAAVSCAGPPSPPATPTPAPTPAAPAPLPVQTSGRVEVLWDTWGVPHIFARDPVALFWAFGRAQMESHADLLLRLYGQARGRAAEYWGEEYLDSDRWVHLNGIPQRAREWRARQGYYFAAYLDAFAAGINAWGEAHPELIGDDVEVVLPVTSDDVLAHVLRVIHFHFLTNPGAIQALARQWSQRGARGAGGGVPSPLELENPAAMLAGSNAWAISPARTAGGHAMLLANPHLPWGDMFTWYEAQLSLPDMDVYGAALVGMPTLALAFNDALGWTHTVNTLDGADLYELTLDGSGYMFDGRVRTFETETVTLRVRQADGAVREEPLVIRRSLHGPVIAQAGTRALALRVAGVDRPHLLEQLWNMMRAQNLGAFEAALSQLQLPMFTVMYADREGHILHVFNGAVPVRRSGTWQTWSGIVPGNTSAMLWDSIHPYNELPRVLDPESGWLQNANDPPWTTTFPPALRPALYPPYMAPRTPLGFRPQRSARMLAEDSVISFDELLAYAHDTYVEPADHVLEDVVMAGRQLGSERAKRAAQVLADWDRRTDAESRGALLFQAFWRQYVRQRLPTGGALFDVPWTLEAPFSTPDGIADPQAAASALDAATAQLESRFGRLDVPWGEVHRLRRDHLDLPAQGGPGGMGIFRVLEFTEADDGTFTANFGDTWIAVIEFSRPVRASALLVYGNASQPGSPHRTDQLPLFAEKRMRPVWRTRAEIEAHLAKRDVF